MKLSTAFHPDTNCQAEHTIKTVENLLRACVIDFKRSWNDHLPLIKFSYNNGYHSSISLATLEALYCRICRSLVGWFELVEISLFGPAIICVFRESLSH